MKSFYMEWIPADSIKNWQGMHSDAMHFHFMLLAIPGEDYAKLGYYLGGLIKEFRIAGSPSKFEPTHWMPLPPLPNTQPDKT